MLNLRHTTIVGLILALAASATVVWRAQDERRAARFSANQIARAESAEPPASGDQPFRLPLESDRTTGKVGAAPVDRVRSLVEEASAAAGTRTLTVRRARSSRSPR